MRIRAYRCRVSARIGGRCIALALVKSSSLQLAGGCNPMIWPVATAVVLSSFVAVEAVHSDSCIDYRQHMRWLSAGKPSGYANDVAIANQMAYVAEGFRRPGGLNRFRVVDISSASNPQVVASIDTHWPLRAVAVSGGHAFVAADSVNLLVIDAEQPQIVAQMELPGAAFDLAVAGSYAYVASGAAGIQVVDIDNPEVPRLAGWVDTPGLAIGVFLEGERAYVADQSGVQVLDISQPKNPVAIGSIDTPGDAFDVEVSGNIGVVADGNAGITVIDFSVPSTPMIIGAVAMDGFAVRIAMGGGHAFIASSNSNRLSVFDLDNPMSPRLTGELPTDERARGLTFHDEMLFTGETGLLSGLNVIDVSHPSATAPIGRAQTPVVAFGIDGGLALVGTDESAAVVDVSVKNLPVVHGRTGIWYRATGIEISGNLAYVAEGAHFLPGAETEGSAGVLQVIDLSDWDSPSILATLSSWGYIAGMVKDQSIVYLAGEHEGLIVADVSDPLKPIVIANEPAPPQSLVSDIGMSGKHVFLLDSSGLSVIDVSDPHSPRTEGRSSVRGQLLSAHGDIVCVVGNAGLQTIDVSDPKSPALLGAVQLPSMLFVYDITMTADHAYVATEQYGIYVVDVSSAVSPRLIGSVPCSQSAHAVLESEELLYVGTFAGLEIFPAQCRVADPVSLGGLEAVSKEDGIHLRWRAHPGLFSEFRVWRAMGGHSDPEDETYLLQNEGREIPGLGPWEYLDRQLSPGLTYWYRVEGERRDGGQEWIGPVAETAGQVSQAPAIAEIRVVPNPAWGTTIVDIDLASSGDVRCNIYDGSGRCVRHLVDKPLPLGRHQVTWDGKNDRGVRVVRGIYIARLESAGLTRTAQFLLMKD